jgi:DNA-binding PadR family transcriptional regulator
MAEKNIFYNLKISKQQIIQSLKNLQNKGIMRARNQQDVEGPG